MQDENYKTFEGGIEMPDDNMKYAVAGTILGTLGTYLIGLIIGVVAIFFASNVKKYFANNDYIDAKQSGQTAKTLGIIAIVLGVIGIIAQIMYHQNIMESLEGYINLSD